MQKCQLTVVFGVWLFVATTPAEAYIGPGAGAGAIAVVLGIIASVVMAFLAILWYPVKRLLKKKKAPQSGVAAEQPQGLKDMDRS